MLKVKPFRQSPGLCGAASLKMVLGYYGIEKTETQLAKLLKSSPKTGTRAKNILKVAKSFGLKGLVKDRANLKDIKKYLDKKIPVIIDWFSTDEGHYSVAIGMDKKNIYLQDPELGAVRTLPLATFFTVWFDFPGDFIKSPKDIILRRMIVIYK